MRILQIEHSLDLKKIMNDISVDWAGIKIMLPKGLSYAVKINSISNIAANIIKQEMLSLGAEAAVSRDCLTGKAKKTDCLLLGNLSQINRLRQKLRLQPFGLNLLGSQLSEALSNYQKNNFLLCLGKNKLNLGRRPHIMGVINLTPDSFSGDGFYKHGLVSLASNVSRVVEFAEKMVEDGADIIDVGGESSRPRARPVSVKEEIRRAIPAIKALSKKIKIPISIDTRKYEVAKAALENGASMLNDISALKNIKMAKLAARHKAAVVIMHMRGNPENMQKNIHYDSMVEEIIEYLGLAIQRAKDNGIKAEKIIIDPGIGFGKTLSGNLQIIKRLREFKALGRPILIGVSRKSFIGKILKAEADERIFGTVSSCVLAVNNGAGIVRVHDVKQVKQALLMSQAISRPELFS